MIAVLVFVALMTLDVLTTFIGLNNGALEGNPFARIDYMVIMKIIGTLIILGGLRIIWEMRYARFWLYGANTIMGIVVLNNVYVAMVPYG